MTAVDPAELPNAKAITREVREGAGVVHITDPAELPRGYTWPRFATTPAWLFWWRRPGGDWVPQVRPDNPLPDEKGKPVKYVFPTGTVLPIGVHPAVAERVTGPARPPLLIVEGTKQYLAAVSHLGPDLAAVGISGCWNWREKATGKPVPDWDGIPLDREVIISPDKDRTI